MEMNGAGTASALVCVLDEVTRERSRLEVDLDGALTEIEREEASSRRAIEEGQRRLAALRELRREHEARLAGLATEMHQREWAAVRDGLGEDRDRLVARASLVHEAIVARESALNAELRQPELATALVEYQKYREAEPGLAAMPADYRAALTEQHRRVLRRLDPYISAANAGPPPLGVPPVGVGVIATVDPFEGRAQALVVVLPVPYEVYAEWSRRPEDLCSHLSYRMVAVVFRLLAVLGAPDAPVRYVSVHGCLAIQVWLGDHEVEGDLRERSLELIAMISEEAPELWAAGVELYTLWLRPDLLGEEPA